jgi:hypothetical protein
MTPPRACMGGWGCPRRERCGHHQTERRWMPAERLCMPGQFDQWTPLDAPATPRGPAEDSSTTTNTQPHLETTP